MENLNKDYVYLDGIWLKEDRLLQMARQAGSIVVAEHYLCAYLTNAVLNGNRDAIKNLNVIRKVYNLETIPFTEDDDIKVSKDNSDDLARKKYQGMTDEKKSELMRTSLKQLIVLHRDLFLSRNHWNGIYLVVHDRLDGSIKKTDFADQIRKVTPSDWPDDLAIGDSTLGNFSHYVIKSDKGKAYYSMKKNPWKEICETLWEIVKEKILTNN